MAIRKSTLISNYYIVDIVDRTCVLISSQYMWDYLGLNLKASALVADYYRTYSK